MDHRDVMAMVLEIVLDVMAMVLEIVLDVVAMVLEIVSDVVAMVLEVVLEGERQKKRLMEESLRAQQVALEEKNRELSMLRRKKQAMLAEEAAKKNLVDDFLVFIGATENNNLEIPQNFDEKAMFNTIATMMKSHGEDNGGIAGDYGDYNLLGIDLGLLEKAPMDAIVALGNGVGSCGGANGGFAFAHGGMKIAPENAHNLGEEDKMTATEGTKCDGGEGSNAGGHGGNYNGNCRK